MEKTLATEQIAHAMEAVGLNQSTLAERLGVSREAVSKWLKKETFPKPDKLLRLATTLGLSFSDLVTKEDPHAPVVAFRKVKATKTTEAHYAHAQTMGKMLRHLVPYVPFDKLEMPPVLKNPVLEYSYLQSVATKIRAEINLSEEAKIDFIHLIQHFKKLQAVLVPVLWGNKNRHENATHIFLPDSMTTWVYLNLDVNILDFKFWMAHELGHCLAPDVRGEAGEDFADAFAGALLFPHQLAKKAYEDISPISSKRLQINEIIKIAREHVISPYSVYCQANAYAKDAGLNTLVLTPDLHKASTVVNRELPLVSTILFEEDGPPETAVYIERIEQVFDTTFFKVLREHLNESKKGPGLIQTIMDVSALDARSIHSELLECHNRKS